MDVRTGLWYSEDGSQQKPYICKLPALGNVSVTCPTMNPPTNPTCTCPTPPPPTQPACPAEKASCRDGWTYIPQAGKCYQVAVLSREHRDFADAPSNGFLHCSYYCSHSCAKIMRVPRKMRGANISGKYVLSPQDMPLPVLLILILLTGAATRRELAGLSEHLSQRKRKLGNDT